MNKLRLVGIDLAGTSRRPSGWALLEKNNVTVKELMSDNEILTETVKVKPVVVAIDAPLSLPRCGALRKADKDMKRRGYPVLPPLFPAMKELTLRGMRLANKLSKKEIKVIEVHPTSTRKALQMPLKNWSQIQKIFLEMGLRNELERRVLTSHEIDAITAAITAYLYVKGEIENIGDQEEGFIVVPISKHWKEISLTAL